MISKKALSGIVTTVSVIAVAIVLGVLAGSLLTSSVRLQLGPAVSCTQLGLQSTLAINSACYDADSEEVQVSISRPLAGADITRFGFALSSSTENLYSTQCGPLCGTCTLLQKGETKLYRLPATAETTQIALSVEGCAIASSQVVSCTA